MVEIAVKEYDFRAVRMMGAVTNCRPNDALCFPIYTKCIELGIPIVINIGFPGPIQATPSTSVPSTSTTCA